MVLLPVPADRDKEGQPESRRRCDCDFGVLIMSQSSEWDSYATDGGQTFYYNRTTGETVWQLPAGVSPANFYNAR